MEELQKLIAEAKALLTSPELDRKAYSAVENFVLKNGSRLKHDLNFQALKGVLAEVARKFGIPSIEKLQEGFGANSCSQ